MTAGGDPEAIRTHARRLRTRADDVARTGDRVRRGAGVEWAGVAAERYRERLHAHGRDVTAAHEEMLDAARALDTLADELESRQEAIRRAMRLVEDRVDDARRVVGWLGDLADDALTGAERGARDAARSVLRAVGDALPAPGAPDWSGLAERVGRLW
jgi:uncharacterized protein YukE